MTNVERGRIYRERQKSRLRDLEDRLTRLENFVYRNDDEAISPTEIESPADETEPPDDWEGWGERRKSDTPVVGVVTPTETVNENNFRDDRARLEEIKKVGETITILEQTVLGWGDAYKN